MTRAVHRAGFRPLLFASRQLLLRPALARMQRALDQGMPNEKKA